MWTVTRQHQWPDGNFVVEVSAGGIDYCNPDALGKKYPGEFEEFVSKVAAVEAAITIAKAWQKDNPPCPELADPDKRIQIATGGTGGMTMPFSGEELTEETFAALRKEAAESDEKLPKCGHCGEILSEKWHNDFDGDFVYCSENCASLAADEWQKEEA
jgi:hypothetical protein